MVSKALSHVSYKFISDSYFNSTPLLFQSIPQKIKVYAIYKCKGWSQPILLVFVKIYINWRENEEFLTN